MKVGIIGSGTVGQHLAKGFERIGFQVMIGTRSKEKLKEWKEKEKLSVEIKSNREAAEFAELIVFCPAWKGAENALELAGKENFEGKTVIDTTNPLVFEEEGKPPKPGFSYPESAGKRMQELLENSQVVKAFNIVPAPYMINPKMEEGSPDMFIAGNSEKAKKEVEEILRKIGWNEIHDLGKIEESYLLEGLAMLWIIYGFRNNYWQHAFKLLKK